MSNIVSLFNDRREIDAKPVIVLADDDPAIRLMIHRVLEPDGYEIIDAVDGLEAIKAVKEHHPAVILLDAVMPGMDGFATCTAIKDKGFTDVPVMMITGLDDDASVERAYSVGAIDYITKPIKWAILKHRVKNVVAGAIAERKVKLLAYHDVLTSLPNRLLFADRLEQSIARSGRKRESMALLLVNIDGFKLINDSFGHEEGDKLIQAIADILNKSLRRADTVARLGGDEFAIIVDDINGADDVTSIADNLTTLLAHNVKLDDEETFTTASIGIALYPDDGKDARTLLKNADTAMLRAKEGGRGNFQFYRPEMNVTAMARLDLENSLRKAIDNEEFVIHYLPYINLQDNDIAGVETLIRWQHPEKGIIKPADFIPIAEESGLILALGVWVIRSACLQISRWKSAGVCNTRVSFNISKRQFKEQDLVALFKTVLEECKLDGSSIMIELTETALIENVDEIKPILIELHAMGITIAIDNFGVGLSSLANIKDFPIDIVKIDRSLVEGIPDSEDDLTIINAIVGLAKGLKVPLLASGIENKRQLKTLNQLGCTYGQGYYWSRALPSDEFEQFYLNKIYNLEQK